MSASSSSAAQPRKLSKSHQSLLEDLIERRDVDGLKKVAVTSGLGNSRLRALAWPLLCGVRGEDVTRDFTVNSAFHVEASQVDMDVQRSLWCVKDDREREMWR